MKLDRERLKEMIEKYEEKTSKDTKEVFTPSGLDLALVYTPFDVEDIDYVNELGLPGDIPFTRGIRENMYRGRVWTMRQYAGFGSAKETNERYKYLLASGQTGLSVAFDLPTQIGYDSDSPYAFGEVGKVGVAVDTVEDMHTLFADIDLEKVSVSMTINASALPVLAMFIVMARERGFSPAKLSGTTQNDILKEYIARGTYVFPPRPSLKLTCDIFEYCSKNMPKWNTISISGYHIREAGANAIQEVAFTLANAITYVKEAIAVGLEVDSFASRLSFFFNAHKNFFEEIAKFRAARKLWAKIMKERFGAKDKKSMMLRFHTQTAGSTLTAQQPLNNIVRTTIEALASVLGGTQSLHTNAYDEALALPTEDSASLALRTQQIIAYETGVTDVADPLGGSYYIEHLTKRIEEEALNYIKKIDEMGGAIAAIENGYMAGEINRSAYEEQLKIDRKKTVVVGVNEFIIENEKTPELLKINPEIEKEQIARLEAVRKKRDARKVSIALDNLREAAATRENLFPPVLEAVSARATLGEIMNVFRSIYGEYTEKTSI